MSSETFSLAIILPSLFTLNSFNRLNMPRKPLSALVNMDQMLSNGTVESKSRTNLPLKYYFLMIARSEISSPVTAW